MEFFTAALILLTLLLLPLLYRRLNEPYTYWKKKGIPSAPAVPLFGSSFESFTKKMHEVEVEWYQNYGRIYGHYESWKPSLSVAEPDLLRDIFVKDFNFFINLRDISGGMDVIDNMVFNLKDEEWKRVRTVITPAFSTGKIRKMFEVILDSAVDLGNNMLDNSKSGKPINAKRTFGAFAMDVIASSAFGTKVDSCNDPDNAFVRNAKEAFTATIQWRIIVAFVFPWLQKLFRISIFSPSAMNFFKEVTMQIIQERKRTGNKRNDFLQMMMDALDEAENGSASQEISNGDVEQNLTTLGHKEKSANVLQQTQKSKGISYEELVANCVVFFTAGYETTGTTLAFVSYLLAVNPECQETLIREIDENIRKNENKLTYEAVQSMKYMDMVISELRMFPPLIRTERLTEADYTLGNTGIIIPKGMFVTIPIYAIQHDAKFYPDPEKFDPNRFSSEEKVRRNAYTFLPFGAGPRNCLGMRFALTEIKICLSYILSQFRFKRCEQTSVPLEFSNGSGLLQPKEIILQIQERTDKI